MTCILELLIWSCGENLTSNFINAIFQKFVFSSWIYTFTHTTDRDDQDLNFSLLSVWVAQLATTQSRQKCLGELNGYIDVNWTCLLQRWQNVY